MDALKVAIVLGLVAFSPAACAQTMADPVARWRPIVAQASARFGVPVPWIERVIRAESGGQTMLGGTATRSRAGAMGLMQLMPATWAAMRDRLHLGLDPDDPHDNIVAGTAYLRTMADRFGYPGLFAAYNSGPGRYADYLAGWRHLPAETIAYIRAVTGGHSEAPVSTAGSPPALLFALRHDLGQAPASADDTQIRNGLFAIRDEHR
jgi:soluble lytic murein transglycosylase-like protein